MVILTKTPCQIRLYGSPTKYAPAHIYREYNSRSTILNQLSALLKEGKRPPLVCYNALHNHKW